MEKFVAVVFDSEADAFKGETALRDLHNTGDMAVYAAAVIGGQTVIIGCCTAVI